MPKPTASQIQEFESIIYNTATKNGIPRNLALLLVSQSKHETALFSSPVFWENKNMFGYKYVPGAKLQDSSGRISTEGDPYAKYATYENSVLEVVGWLKRRVKEGKFPPLEKITTEKQYAELLKNAGYYGDPVKNYLSGLIRFFNSDIGKNSGNIAAVIIIFVLLVYLMQNK
jgi:hypothetical protein